MLPLDNIHIQCYYINSNIKRGDIINIYTVSFFGHRYIERQADIEQKLDKLLKELITKKEYIEFLIGRDGDFDIIAAAAIKRAIEEYSWGNTFFKLILPYQKSEFIKNEKYYLNYYNEIEICSEAASAHFKAAYSVRNQNMVDRSDLVIFCLQHNSGGAYQTYLYSKEKNKKTINLADT